MPRSTRIDSLHFEAALPPLHVRYDVATAYQAEKHRRHPPTDPIYRTAHQVLPPSRLKRSNWQYHSDAVLARAGLYHARLDDHRPSPPGLISLQSHQPLHFVPSIPPWKTDGSYRIHISPKVPGIHRKITPIDDQRAIAEATLDRKRKQSSLAFASNIHPCKRQRLAPTTTMACPAGHIDASCKAEKVALELPPNIISQDPAQCEHSNLFIGSDSQSSLMALVSGPL